MAKPKKSALLAATEKQVKKVAAEIKRTGKLRSAATGRFIKATTRNANNKAIQQAQKQLVKSGKSVVKDSRQIKKTTQASVKLFKTLLGGSKKKTATKTQPKSQTKPQHKKQAATKTKPSAKIVSKTPSIKVSKPPQKKQKKTPQQRVAASRVYELIDLPETFNNDTLNSTLEELEENAEGYDSFLRPGEGWGFKFGTGQSYKFYSHFDLLVRDLGNYKTIEENGDDPDAKEDIADLIKIMRFKAPGKNVSFQQSVNAWQGRKKAEIEKRVEKKRARVEKSRAKEKTIKSLRKSKAQLENELQELRFENARLKAYNKQIAEERKAAKKHTKKKSGGKRK